MTTKTTMTMMTTTGAPALSGKLSVTSPLMNALTETVKKYSPQRVDHSYLALNRAFGLDGRPAEIFA